MIPSPNVLPGEIWPADLNTSARAEMSWLWQGYLAPGNVTLLTSQWKAGKTTLVSVLLARRTTGGLLAGRPLTAGKTVVVSEESPAHWAGRQRKLDFGNHTCFLCRPFRGKPRPDEWLALLDRLAWLRAEHGADLAVIDPLAAFLPGRDENHAGLMLEALLPLQRLTNDGMSVLLVHHPRKDQTRAGQAARGSGALCSYVDILIEMSCSPRAAAGDRRRRLHAFSRHEETPRQLVIELNAEGTDYAGCGDFEEVDFGPGWERLRAVLGEAPYKLTRQEIGKSWPDGVERPDEVSLWRWLERAVAQGLVCRDGTGHRSAPYRYWLPGQIEKWRREGLYLEDLPPLDELRGVGEQFVERLRGKGRKGQSQ
jgi:hypothetical protein